MPRSGNQKLKILYVMEYLLHASDESHPVTVSQITDELARHGITAEHRTILEDMEALRVFGLDIVKTGNNRYAAYYVASRDFELPELKLLVDSVQSSRFLTQKKTATLIKKIETLASIHEAQLLQRQVYVSGRVKTMNESIYYNVDAIHNGISQNRKIRFRYFEYTVKKERRYRKNGAWYLVSPFALTWDNQNYYLIAYDADAGFIKHYRVDKMTDIETTEEEQNGVRVYQALDMSSYTEKVFGMFAGKEVRVRMRFAGHLAGSVLDRLGMDVMLVPEDDDEFTVTADVVPSPQFFAWITGFGAEAKILGPERVVAQMREYIDSVAALYHEGERKRDG